MRRFAGARAAAACAVAAAAGGAARMARRLVCFVGGYSRPRQADPFGVAVPYAQEERVCLLCERVLASASAGQLP